MCINSRETIQSLSQIFIKWFTYGNSDMQLWLLGTLLSIHTTEEEERRKIITEGSGCGCIGTMWLPCYSPGCGAEACASWDSPYDAPPDTKTGPWALKADRADVNVLPAALSPHRSSAPQRPQARLMSFQTQLKKYTNTLKKQPVFHMTH